MSDELPTATNILTHFVLGKASQEIRHTWQYLELEKTGILNISLVDDFHGVYWYGSAETVQSRPYISIANDVKSGTGYYSGDYNIETDGSLVIQVVSFKHERNFTAMVFLTQSSLPIRHIVPVKVFGKSLQPYYRFLLENSQK